MKTLRFMWVGLSTFALLAGSALAASFTWQVPNNGNWSVAGNWQGPPPSAPLMGGSNGYVLAFGDNGTPYVSANDLTDGANPAFVLNQLQLSNSSAAISFINGSPLLFTTNGGTLPSLDCVAGAGGGFTFSNAITFATNVTVGGAASSGTERWYGAVTNLGTLTMTGAYTVALSNANNNFVGPLVLNCAAGGELRADHLNALRGSGNITISNGTLRTTPLPDWDIAWYLAYNQSGRQGLVTGSGSAWTNRASFYVARGASSSNNTLTEDSGGRFYCANGGFVGFGASFNSLIVTNGGQCTLGGNWGAVGNGGANNTLAVTGTGSVLRVPVNFLAVGGGRRQCPADRKGRSVRRVCVPGRQQRKRDCDEWWEDSGGERRRWASHGWLRWGQLGQPQ